jgi:hypothetical protein
MATGQTLAESGPDVADIGVPELDNDLVCGLFGVQGPEGECACAPSQPDENVGQGDDGLADRGCAVGGWRVRAL